MIRFFKHLCVFFLGIYSTASFGQMTLDWQQEINLSDYDYASALTELPEGGYAFIGTSYPDRNHKQQAALVQLDLLGNVVSEQFIGLKGIDEPKDLLVNKAGFLMVGNTTSKGQGDADIWILQTDRQGAILWEKTYGGTAKDGANSICSAPDNSYVITGFKKNPKTNKSALYTFKIDQQGELLWESELDTCFRNWGNKVIASPTGFLVAGVADPIGRDAFKDEMGVLIQYDKNGAKIWTKIVGGEEEDGLTDVVLHKQSIWACGYTESKEEGKRNSWLMNFDLQGKIISDFNFRDGIKEEAQNILFTDDQLYLTTNTKRRESNSRDVVLYRVNAKGERTEISVIDAGNNENVADLMACQDGGLIAISESCTPYLYDSNPVKCSYLLTKWQNSMEKSVQHYINTKMLAWKTRGEFEKKEAFEKRISDKNSALVNQKHFREAVTHYTDQQIDFKRGTLSKYNADTEEFQLHFPALGNFAMAVSIDRAQAFKIAWKDAFFDEAEYTIANNQLSIKKLHIHVNGFVYHYTENTGFKHKGKSDHKFNTSLTFRSGGDPLKGLNIAKNNAYFKGKSYALVIGIDNYKGNWNQLNNAVRDAQGFEQTLKQHYKIDVVKSLYDEHATRENIINAFVWLVDHVKEEDNVVIYYSGHGDYKKSLKKGYWIPADAQTNSIAAYISNADIQTFLNGIPSKHTLLIADACFSGDIFRGSVINGTKTQSEKYYLEMDVLKSRQAITSGGIEPVMDGGKDGHSVFAYYLLKALNTNNQTYMDAAELFTKIKVAIVNNSDQTPNLQPIKNTGDEGGQFIFVKE